MREKSKVKLITVIIPTYNEEKVIANCLKSLAEQSYKPFEIIVVDDGSTDKTLHVIKNLKFQITFRKKTGLNLVLLKQNHKGPGPARNLGAKHAKGEILVFVDADMTFDRDFIKDLIKPIIDGKTIGTFSKNEMNANRDNIWSRCWNINRGWPTDRLIPPDYPNTAPVYRAILKKEFDKVGGFATTGEYTDDWSLSRKLDKKSTLAKGAVYYHKNPSSLKEVFKQARWIGKNEFISGNLVRRIRSLILYSVPISLAIAVYKSFFNFTFYFLIFKFIYDLAIFTSVVKSFLGERKSK